MVKESHHDVYQDTQAKLVCNTSRLIGPSRVLLMCGVTGNVACMICGSIHKKACKEGLKIILIILAARTIVH